MDRTLKKRTDLSVNDIMDLLTFTAKSTYFQYKDKLYKQKQGFAMGDPLSAIMSNFFMEDFEQKAIETAPQQYKPTFWKRYVDDILEKVKKGATQQLTDHLNKLDTTGNIKVTCEEEQEGRISFLDINIHHKQDGSIKTTIYRKPTHTDQYLLWTSEHPTAHKLSVVRTLFERLNYITDEQDKIKEEAHITQALRQCQYPQWAINKGKQQVTNKDNKKKQTRKPAKTAITTIDTVTVPYIRGVTEPIQRALKKHNISAIVKPHTKLRQLLVHPKDKIKPDNKCNVIYEIPCKTCHKTYIGETGRSFNTRKQEHKKECEKETSARLTRSTKEKAQQENLKSAISDHCKRENHVMDWEGARIVGTEDQKYKRWIREAIEIRKRGNNTMNRDEGAFTLAHTWDTLLQRPPQGGRRGQSDRCQTTVRLATPGTNS